MNTPTTRLTRSRNDRMIAGVAGGIARYLAIDPVLVRLAFVALIFTGPGVLLYPVLWLVMPQESGQRSSFQDIVSEARQQAARLGEEAQTVFVNEQKAEQPTPRFDPMTGQPLPEAAPARQPRNRLLGYILVAVGMFLLVNMFLPGFEEFLFPTVLVVAGFMLLRRTRQPN